MKELTKVGLSLPTSPLFIGFEDVFRTLSSFDTNNKYPPHDLIKNDDYTYTIHMALAGFSKDEIEITKDQNFLVIESDDAVLKMKENNTVEATYIHRGIAKRAFSKKFSIKDGIEVESANFKDGILSIVLKLPKTDQSAQVIKID